MGWFSSPTKESTSKSADGGTIAPDRSKRERCYESRDLFFDCLDENNILDAIKYDGEARAKCPKEVEVYERDCARSWVRCPRWKAQAWDMLTTVAADKILQRETSNGVQSGSNN